MIDATFWVAISFLIFLALLIYLKVPSTLKKSLGEKISNIKSQIENAEKLKDEANIFLSEQEKKISNSKKEVSNLLKNAEIKSEKELAKMRADLDIFLENKKNSLEMKIVQLKNQALKDIKNASVRIALESVEKLLKNSLDKSKLDKIYSSSIEETKLALKKKSS